MTTIITVEYIDHMGSDLTVVNAARASFDKASEWISDIFARPYKDALYQPTSKGYLKESDAKLIRFLASGYRTGEWERLLDSLASGQDKGRLSHNLRVFKNKAQHWAPFAHPQVQVRVEMPIFLARQMVKHQQGGVWSELSRRYVSDGLQFWLPEVWHTRPEDVKQGSGAPVDDQRYCQSVAERTTNMCEAAYMTLLAEGVAPEEARAILPANLMTTVVWTGSLLFWARVCNQRLDSHAQLAAQELAAKLQAVIQPLFPVSWKELVDVG